jgi:hypothetical protein
MSDDIDRASQNGRHQREAHSEPKKATNGFEFILIFRHVKDLQFCRRGVTYPRELVERRAKRDDGKTCEGAFKDQVRHREVWDCELVGGIMF